MRTVGVVCALGLVLACGGGGGSGGSGNGGSPPTISNLQYSPGSAFYKQGGGSVTLNGTFTFSDPDGDVTTLRLTTATGNLDTAIQGVSGIKSGTLNGTFLISSTQVGHFTFQVSLLDSQGHSSNGLPGTFDVIPDDTATHWTQHTVPATLVAEQFWGVAWSGSSYVAVGTHGAIVRSPDGAIWTQSTSPTTSDLYRATWAGTQFVAVGAQGTILTSPDGVAWTQQRSTGVQGDILYGVAWSGTRMVAAGVTHPGTWFAPVILHSLDGISWLPIATPANVNTGADCKLYAVASSGSGFVAVGDGLLTGQGQSGMVWTSPDGLTWSATTPGSYAMSSVFWNGSEYVICCLGGPYVSTNGISWTHITTSYAAYEVGWSGSHFLFILNILNGYLYTTDFTSSSPPLISLPGVWYGHGQLVWGPYQWVVPGGPGTIWTSP